MKRLAFILTLGWVFCGRAEPPTNIVSAVDYTCEYNQSGSSLTNPVLYLCTNAVFSYHGYPTNLVNVVAGWPQNAQGQGYSGCATNELGAEARGLITNLNGATQPGLDVTFSVNAQAFELHGWDESDDYCDIYDEDDGSLTTFNCGENAQPQWYLVQYATRKLRHLRIYFECNTAAAVPGIFFNGVNVGQGDSLTVDTNWTPGMMVEGDSYCQGYNPGAGKWFYDSYATLAGFLTNGGAFHVLADGIGGSGFLANGEGTNYAARFFTDVLPYTNLFRFFVLQASINDGTATNPATGQAYTAGEYYAAVTNLLGLAQRYLPNKELAVMGIPYNDAPNGAYNPALNTNAMAAARAMNVPYFDALDELSIPAGDVGWDGVHLDQAGYQLVANYLNSRMAETFTDYPATSYLGTSTNQSPASPPANGATTNLSVGAFGASGDGVCFSVNTVSNSNVVCVSGTNVFSSADVGKVIEVFGAGPWLTYSNWGVVVTQQDIVCLITNVTQGTNLSLSIPCGWTMNAYCVVGTNNAPAFQAAINAATALVSSGQDTNVTINIPAGTYLLMSSNVLNPNYVMNSLSDTHPALTISSGGITLQGDTAADTILMGCGAGMEHVVAGGLAWIGAGYAPYVPMRDTLVECRGPVANNQYPLVLANLTLDGGLTNGQQSYNYWVPLQGNGAGWDTTHHAVADWDGNVSYQMNQVKEFTNCVFEHWRGEMCICWTGIITNGLNDWENCQFLDGNATADNMYYGQKFNGCVFNGVGKVMEYYQNNGYTNSSIMENCLITNISELAGPGNVHVDCAITGAVTNRTMPSFTFIHNQFYDNVGMEFFSLNAGENVSFISNSFAGAGSGINLTGIGQQPTDGTQVWYMTNILVVGNSFSCGYPLSIGYGMVEGLMCSNNTGFSVAASIGYATNNVLSGNTGYSPNNSIYYDLGTGPGSPPQGVIQSGQYFIDLTNNNWALPGNDAIDGGDYFPTDSIVSYGNGRQHFLRNSAGVFYLDDLHPGMIPAGATLQVHVSTWNGANITRFYTSQRLAVQPMTLTNATSQTFYWNGSAWSSGNTVSFTASPTESVSGSTVQFHAPSVDGSGTTIETWQWTFGDGTSGTGQNPTHVYTNTGTFYPALTVSNISGQSSGGSGPAIISDNPTVQFSMNTSNCISGTAVQFSSPAQDSGGNAIRNWLWNFGDGTTGMEQNPVHVYTNTGTYYPTLTVANLYGLSATSDDSAITVIPPAIQFTEKPTNGVSRLTVQFSSPSQDSGNNSIRGWAWSYGDGTVGTGQNPSHSYASVGTYYPVLVITNSVGDTASYTGGAITVTNPVTSFTATPTNACPNLTVQFRASGNDSGNNTITNWSWNFGDGTTGTGQNPVHVYTNTGTYYPVLTALNAYGLAPTSTGQSVMVSNPAIQFTEKPTNGVSRLTVQFSSPGVDSLNVSIRGWAWSYGDGTVGTGQNPSHSYASVGTYYPVLVITNSVGDTASYTGGAITVTNPVTSFTATPTNACPNLTVQFRASGNDSGNNTITNWSWNFGDGTTGTGQNPVHVYTNTGTYYPVLTALNAYGLAPTSTGQSVMVSNPAIQFTEKPTNGVSRLTVQFSSPGVDSLNVSIRGWAWSYGDGTVGTGQNPSHSYASVGTYYPVLVITNSVGDTASYTGGAITVTNPVTSFTATPTNACPNLTVQFRASGNDSGNNTITNWSWNFGDGTTGTGQNPVHVYTNTGTYYPVLTALNAYGLAPTSTGQSVMVSNPAIQFTEKPTNGVSRLTVQFSSPGVDSLNVSIRGWAWSYGDGTVGTGQNPSHSYASVGTYYPVLVITNSVGDTASYTGGAITVTNPVTSFTATPTNACPNLTVQFRASGNDSGNNTITNWSWNFGDGTTGTGQNPVHVYTNTGTYYPVLTALNAYGLAPTSTGQSVMVSNPAIQFTEKPTNGVSRLTVQFSSPGVDSLNVSIRGWAWSYGDGTVGTGQNPSHSYASVGTYYPVLVITNSVGDTASYTGGAITVTNPVTSFTATPTNACPNLTVQFRASGNDSGNNTITNWSWNFGDGTTGTGQNPVHVYTNTGTYYPVLTALNAYGLAPTSTGQSVMVSNPAIQFTEKPTNGVSRLTVQFSSPGVDSLNVSIRGWAWSYGDGTVGTGQNPSHSYASVGTYYPVLVITNSVGDTASYTGGAITVTNPMVKFTATPTNGNLPLSVQFRAPGNDSGNNTITNWSWNFGDGTTGTGQNPVHIYTNNGVFYPMVTSVNINGLTPTSSGPYITAGKVQVAVGVIPSPQLALTISVGNVILSWPTNAVGYTLQSTTNFMPPFNWTTITSSPAILNSRNVVTNPMTGSQMFFRLIQ